MTIHTTRLTLELLSEKDTSFILELLNSEGWIKNIGNRNIHTEEDALAYIQRITNNPDITYWNISLKENKSSIGVITFIKRDFLAHNDIGFALLPAYYNKGYAYEATQAVLLRLAENNITNILAYTLPNNFSCIKLLEKLGFTFEKSIVQEGEELHLYSNIKNED